MAWDQAAFDFGWWLGVCGLVSGAVMVGYVIERLLDRRRRMRRALELVDRILAGAKDSLVEGPCGCETCEARREVDEVISQADARAALDLAEIRTLRVFDEQDWR